MSTQPKKLAVVYSYKVTLPPFSNGPHLCARIIGFISPHPLKPWHLWLLRVTMGWKVEAVVDPAPLKGE